MIIPVPRAIDATTRFLALIGDPVAHSLTPVIQNAALAQLGLNVVNIALRVPAERLADAVAGARAAGLLGLMVTIPHKAAALQLADRPDPLAELLGAANLLHFREDGHTVAYNTDVVGAERSLHEHGVALAGTRFLVLGAGGAARALVLHFLHQDAGTILLANRTRARAEALAQEATEKLARAPHVVEWNEAELIAAARACEVVINTTSVGMTPHRDATPLPAAALRPGLVVYDLVYNPLETRLLREARAAGARPLDGVGMLVTTNERAVEICCGVRPDAQLMRDLCVQALSAPS